MKLTYFFPKELDETAVIVVGGNCGPWLSTVEVFDSKSWQWISGPGDFGIW